MTRLWVIIASGGAILSTGCTFGVGSAYTGEWRARRETESVVCIEDGAGKCVETKAVVRDVAARSFSGFVVHMPVGVAFGNSGPGVAMSAMGEYLRGHGSLAFGVRAGLRAASQTGFMTPVMLMGRWGNSHIGLHLGAGYCVYVVDLDHNHSNDTFGALGGIDIVLSETVGNRVVLGFESDFWRGTINDREFHSVGILSSLGVYF